MVGSLDPLKASVSVQFRLEQQTDSCSASTHKIIKSTY